MNKGYFKKILIAVFLVFIPTLTFAEPFASSPLWDMFQNLSFTPPVNDMSVAFLVKMFGFVPGVPQFSTAGTTILGTVFGVFNAGILALSGVFLSYTITRVVTETTMDGAAMGKSTTIWTSVRCALSTSLLVPQASGYSLINGIVMWVVVQSIGLADLTWNQALNYLQEGGGTYATSTTTRQIDYSLIDYNVVTGNPNIDSTNNAASVGSADVLRSLVCAHTVRDALRSSQESTRNKLIEQQRNGTISPENSMRLQDANRSIPEQSSVFSVYKHRDCGENIGDCGALYSTEMGLYQFPFIENESGDNPLSKYGLDMEASDIPTNLSGICGTISYATIGGGGGDDVAERAKRYIPAKLQGLQDMINILEQTAKDMVRDSKDGKLDPDVRGGDNAYVVYKDDGTDHYFYTGGPPGYDYESKYSTVLDRINVNNFPAINWPLGADGMLQAASAYQIALAGAQKIGASTVDSEKIAALENAKGEGWITAGSYYNLLYASQKNINKEYNSYRLTGFKEIGAPFDPGDVAADSTLVRTIDASTLLRAATLDGKTDLGAIFNDDYDGNLSKSLNWIYFTYPYSKLRGEVISSDLAKALARTQTGQTASMQEQAFGFLGSGGSHGGKGVIITKLALGSVLVALVPPAAIPLLTPIPILWLKYSINEIYETWKLNMGVTGVTTDPITRLHNVGDKMIEESVLYVARLKAFFLAVNISLATGSVLYQAGAIAAAFAVLATGVGQVAHQGTVMLAGISGMVSTVIFMYLPIALAVLGPMLVTGIMFSIYIPMIPYLLFLFGVISWFISVVVLMAAAPIICFLMLWGNSSQENPLLAREAEQFLMQIIGVFFRPVLMVIGLIVGVILVNIGVDVLNLGFSKVALLVLDGSDSEDLRMFKQFGIVMVYTFTMVSLINMCFSTIYLLYSEAMRVAGIQAPAVGMEEKQLESVKGSTTQMAESAGGGAKEFGGDKSTGSGSFSGLKDAKDKDKKNKAKKESGGS